MKMDGWMTRQMACVVRESRCVKLRVKDEGTQRSKQVAKRR